MTMPDIKRNLSTKYAAGFGFLPILLAMQLALQVGSVFAQQHPITPPPDFPARLVAAARERTAHKVRYDGAYAVIPYPGGDVPANQGVCTDEIIRIYRAVGIDLQKLVHEDMRRDYPAYPKLWGAASPDPNIDHRRVPNLMTFFKRRGAALPITADAKDYRPGDIVAWRLDNGLTHTGLLVDAKSADGIRSLAVHNIGAGPQMEDVLFAWTIIGHYRYPAPSSD